MSGAAPTPTRLALLLKTWPLTEEYLQRAAEQLSKQVVQGVRITGGVDLFVVGLHFPPILTQPGVR